MIAVQENPALTFQGWTRQDKERLLAALAGDLLAESKSAIEIKSSDQTPIATLRPAREPNREFGCEWTPEYMREIASRAATPENSIPWSEMRLLIAKDLGVELPE